MSYGAMTGCHHIQCHCLPSFMQILTIFPRRMLAQGSSPHHIFISQQIHFMSLGLRKQTVGKHKVEYSLLVLLWSFISYI